MRTRKRRRWKMSGVERAIRWLNGRGREKWRRERRDGDKRVKWDVFALLA